MNAPGDHITSVGIFVLFFVVFRVLFLFNFVLSFFCCVPVCVCCLFAFRSCEGSLLLLVTLVDVR